MESPKSCTESNESIAYFLQGVSCSKWICETPCELDDCTFCLTLTLRWYGINNLLYWVKWIKCTWAPRCFMHQVNLWNTMTLWAWWLYLPVESDMPHVKDCIMFFSFMCLHNIMKLLLNKWQCLGCDACIVSSVLFLQSPDLAPILFLQSPNFLSAIDFDVIWNHQSLLQSQMNHMHISFKVFHASSEFVKHHVSLMIVPSCWVRHLLM